MFRNLVAALVATVVFASGAFAAEYKGRITKISSDSITILVGKKKDVKGEEKTLKLGSEVKVVKTVKKVDEPLADGLKNAVFAKLSGGKGGVNATVITTGEGAAEVVSQIKVAGGAAKPKAPKAPKAK